MVLTPSTMLELGTQAPEFVLEDVVSNKKIALETFSGKKGLLVMFICQHCPYVQHIQEELTRIGLDYENEDLGIVAISSNDADNYPDDSPESLKKMAEDLDFRFPFCYDETQEVAKSYTAACTPDFFLFDDNRQLVYRGQLDDSRPENNKAVSGKDLRAAIDVVISGEKVDSNQKPSIGCNIKWKKGNNPKYFK